MLLVGLGNLRAHWDSFKWHSSDKDFEEALNRSISEDDWSIGSAFRKGGIEQVFLDKAKEAFPELKVIKFEPIEPPEEVEGVLD